MKKLKVLSLFSGIGSFEKALTNLGVNFELVGFSEIDKYAIESYCAIHNVDKSKNLGDVSKVDSNTIADFDLMTYGFPCQDISISGRQRGFSENSETRSSLLWEAMKIAKTKKPKYLIAENVKNLVSKKFKEDFDKWITQLDEMGYNTYYEVLNAKDFGVPQSRDRVFVVSIRKDVDDSTFTFPIGNNKNTKLLDILEEEVDLKYYLSDKIQARYKQTKEDDGTNNVIGTTASEFRTIGQRDLVYSLKGTMGTLVATDYKQPKQILVDKYTILYKDKELEADYKKSYLQWDVSGKGYNSQQDRAFYPNGLSGTVPASNSGNKLNVYLGDKIVRKLTPLECWRLMGFSDDDYQKAKSTNCSDSQLYKQAGNSIVVNVIQEILHKLLIKY